MTIDTKSITPLIIARIIAIATDLRTHTDDTESIAAEIRDDAYSIIDESFPTDSESDDDLIYQIISKFTHSTYFHELIA